MQSPKVGMVSVRGILTDESTRPPSELFFPGLNVEEEGTALGLESVDLSAPVCSKDGNAATYV